MKRVLLAASTLLLAAPALAAPPTTPHPCPSGRAQGRWKACCGAESVRTARAVRLPAPGPGAPPQGGRERRALVEVAGPDSGPAGRKKAPPPHLSIPRGR